MIKLEDISKKEIFNVPEGYFDELPGIIQAKVARAKNNPGYRPFFVTSLKYALPLIVILVAGFFWINKPSHALDTESILATIQTEDLVAYLIDSDLTTDELLESVDFDLDDLDEIEGQVYRMDIRDTDFENLLDEIE